MTKKSGAPAGLSTELKNLVHWAVSQLGPEIKRHYGDARFKQVEDLRERMKKVQAFYRFF